MRDLESGNYRQEVLENYRKKYLPENLGTSAEQLSDFVLKRIEK